MDAYILSSILSHELMSIQRWNGKPFTLNHKSFNTNNNHFEWKQSALHFAPQRQTLRALCAIKVNRCKQCAATIFKFNVARTMRKSNSTPNDWLWNSVYTCTHTKTRVQTYSANKQFQCDLRTLCGHTIWPPPLGCGTGMAERHPCNSQSQLCWFG